MIAQTAHISEETKAGTQGNAAAEQAAGRPARPIFFLISLLRVLSSGLCTLMTK